MEVRKIMKLSVERLVNDLDRMRTVVRNIESELDSVDNASDRKARLQAMKVQLSEVHARLDGAMEFVAACQRRVSELSQPHHEEEIDLWL